MSLQVVLDRHLWSVHGEEFQTSTDRTFLLRFAVCHSDPGRAVILIWAMKRLAGEPVLWPARLGYKNNGPKWSTLARQIALETLTSTTRDCVLCHDEGPTSEVSVSICPSKSHYMHAGCAESLLERWLSIEGWVIDGFPFVSHQDPHGPAVIPVWTQSVHGRCPICNTRGISGVNAMTCWATLRQARIARGEPPAFPPPTLQDLRPVDNIDPHDPANSLENLHYEFLLEDAAISQNGDDDDDDDSSYRPSEADALDRAEAQELCEQSVRAILRGGTRQAGSLDIEFS